MYHIGTKPVQDDLQTGSVDDFHSRKMANSDLFDGADLTSSGRPVLIPDEVECHMLSSVDIETEQDLFLPLRSGVLILTTHRLLWLPSTATSAVSIPLASISHIFSPNKSIKSMFHSPRIRFQVLKLSRSAVVTVVVRGKGDWEGFLSKLWECWRGRAWVSGETSNSSVSALTSTPGGLYGSDGTVRMVGLSGILRKEQEMWESTDKSMQEAFQDLNALMSKAKEMVTLAEKMRQKLLSGSNSQAGMSNDEEMGSKEEMQDWLLSVGIISPVTKESAGALYHQQLSRQDVGGLCNVVEGIHNVENQKRFTSQVLMPALADFIRIPLEKAGGMINLIDVYCLFNRARGTELISPEDLLQACSLWEKFDVHVMLRKFDSGVMVIQNKSHSDEEMLARVKIFATKPEALLSGISATDAAMMLGIAPAMAKEHLLTAESKGILCRDVSADGFHFYVNLFPEIDPSNSYLVKDYGLYHTWVRAARASG